MHVRAAVRRARRASKPRRGQRENAWCEATACGPLLAQEVEGEVAQHRQVLAPVADTHPALILAEGDSEDPMGPVLAPPLVADRVPERGGLARPAEQLRCSAPGWGTGRLHLDRRSFPAGCPKRAARVRVRATMWPRRAAYSATASREQAACCRRRGNTVRLMDGPWRAVRTPTRAARHALSPVFRDSMQLPSGGTLPVPGGLTAYAMLRLYA